MANRRMFSKTIVVDSDDFLDMPVSARLLYYDLGMRADDDGFVSPKMIIRMTGASDDDLKVLLAKKYVLLFENKVLIIRDWKINNFIRPDRYTPTIYKEYLNRLKLSENNQYQITSGIPDDIPTVDPDKDRLDKDRLDKDTDMSASADAFTQFWQEYPKKELKKKSEKIWKSKKLDSSLQEILIFIEKAKQTDRWRKGYVKQPPAFLNGECWNDDISAYNDKFQNRSSNLLPAKAGKYENIK